MNRIVIAALFFSCFAYAAQRAQPTPSQQHTQRPPQAEDHAHDHQEDHDEDKNHHGHDHDDGHGNANEEGHEHAHDDHHSEGENSPNVGPEKGITEANGRDGFRLSPEAVRNFELQFAKISGQGPWLIARSAILSSGEETNLFRHRQGFFKRIDFKAQKGLGTELKVLSPDLRDGDEVVTVGVGFLRIAELAASGGVAHGHSH